MAQIFLALYFVELWAKMEKGKQTQKRDGGEKNQASPNAPKGERLDLSRSIWADESEYQPR